MFRALSLILTLQVSILFAQDFTEEFARRLDRIQHPELQLYGTGTLRLNQQKTEKPLYFRQKLDHFKSTNRVKWRQRFFMDETYYKRDRPFFLYIFGNEEASDAALRESQILNYAKDFNALAIGLEHRFYGDSRPFSNTSLENLNYLNIQQALADIANFIESTNKLPQVSPFTQWILFGGFYGGSLAAWARMKYPHLIHGAVASSAIVSFSPEFPEYLESVEGSLFSYNRSCGFNIASAYDQLYRAFATIEGRDKISKMFSVCGSYLRDNLGDKAILRSILIYEIYTAVEQNHNSEYSISTVCNIMTNDSNSSLENLSKVDSLFRHLKKTDCWQTKEEVIFQHYHEEDYKRSDQTDRLWYYQLCSQIGLDLSSKESTDMFGRDELSVESRERYCKEFFGPEFDNEAIKEGVRQTNIEFGAKAFNASNVIFVRGSMDPWESAGIEERPERVLYHVISIDGASHRADLIPSQDINVLKSIHKIKDLMNSWLE